MMNYTKRGNENVLAQMTNPFMTRALNPGMMMNAGEIASNNSDN
jgi:hypothetical protein